MLERDVEMRINALNWMNESELVYTRASPSPRSKRKYVGIANKGERRRKGDKRRARFQLEYFAYATSKRGFFFEILVVLFG